MQDKEQRNLILAVVLSAAIFFAFQFFAPPSKPPVSPTQPNQQHTTATVPGESPAPTTPEATATRAEILAQGGRVTIDTPRVKGSINLKGARLDDLTLADYHETVDKKSPTIVLLSPSGAPDAYFSEQGWIGGKGSALKLPGSDTVWQQVGTGKLTPSSPVTLGWDNGDGLKFTRTIAIDDSYMFTVKDTVTNSGSAPATLRSYALVARSGIPPSTSTWVSYEGPIGVFDGVENEIKYASVTDDKPVERDSTGTWLGFTDKYWLTSIAPADEKSTVKASFHHSGTGAGQQYQADYLGPETTLAPDATIDSSTLVFAGAKEVKLIDRYGQDYGLPNFDKAVDWGWFHFLTKPIFYLLDYIYGLVGNFGIAIMVLTLIIKLIFFPLQTRAVHNLNKMKVLQPEMKKLQEKYADDKVKLNQETMALYKRVGANPVAGCLPILLQIPVFFSLYKVLYVTIEMRHAPFFGWIHDLSAPDPTSIFNLFGVIPFSPPHFLMIGAWPAIYCLTMFLQQRMQPTPPDPVQARMFQLMPFIFTFMMGNFPAGLVIYWSWNNTLTMLQQWVITRRGRATAALAKA
ncbi:MAG TPA: membrane protein insertase YidC [Aliidongia sp.]|nr:membrane protein insertase YidC [Aliidongia sp.]